MKKRLVAIALVAAMTLGMTACGGNSNKTTKNNTDRKSTRLNSSHP